MRRIALALLVVSAVAAAVAVALVRGPGPEASRASSHREAPLISNDPAADNTDLYAFVSPDAPNTVTIVANYIPLEQPAGGPNFASFGDDVRYEIKVDNNGDGEEDVTYRFRFKTTTGNPNTFLYNTGPIDTLSDSDWNVRQSYTVTRINHHGAKVLGTDIPVPPVNIGPRSTPGYDALADAAVANLAGTKVFAGQRDDPFYVDLGATFDAINVREGTGNEGQGKDDFSGMSTSAVVIQLPERKVTRDRKQVADADANNAVVGVWSTTKRRRLQVTNATGAGSHDKAARSRKNRFVQVSRLGNPLINEVVIPLGKKDQFNRTTPDEDAARYGTYALNPELAAILNALFGIDAPEHNRTDIVQALLQGIPDLNQHSGKNAGTPVDTLKLNLGVTPTKHPDRFGVIGGDNAGFPNGRRLEDDVVDIELQVVAGILVGNPVPLGDGVDKNDKPFLSEFPYLAAPDSGLDSNPSDRFEPPHAPVPPGGGS